MRRALLALCLLACGIVAVVTVFPSSPVSAQSIGGGGGGVADELLFCISPIESTVTFSGVATDITTATNEHLLIAPAGTGDLYLDPGGDDIAILDLGGLSNISGRINLFMQSSGAITTWGVAGEGVTLGGQSNHTITQPDFTVVDNGGTEGHFTVYGEGTVRVWPRDAMTISSPTDTASTPLGASNTGAGTACRMSSSGAAAWTPSESGAVDGMFWCCTNTGANSITMTDSDGVYEGPGSVVGQYDQVCFEYVTDRFIERSFSNNEP